MEGVADPSVCIPRLIPGRYDLIGIHHHHVRHSMAYRVSEPADHPNVRVFMSGLPRTVRIPFASNKHASIAKQAIEVDAELQKDAVKRTLMVEGDDLIALVDVPRSDSHS